MESRRATGLHGRRIHIAGSASAKTDPSLIDRAHEIVRLACRKILESGGSLVLGPGKEPGVQTRRTDRPSQVFDWTALEVASECLNSGTCPRSSDGDPPLVVVISMKSESEIPAHRRPLWDELLDKACLRVESILPGARSGALIRERQSQLGDVLLTLGGGTGVEHLAELYMRQKKHVLPLDLPLGASREDGTGGSLRLNGEARFRPERFFALQPSYAAQANSLLTNLSTGGGTADPERVVENILKLLILLTPPNVFCVRLMNREHPAFARVESFFRQIVDPVIESFGMNRIEIGTTPSKHAFINVGIFESLHFSSVAVVDVTAQRPNCYIELGYALGSGNRVLVTAEKGTALPFDQAAIPCHFWDASAQTHAEIAEFVTFWLTNIDRPRIVSVF